jgi:hypothetical protein
MSIHQTRHHVPAWQSLSSRDRLSDQAPGRIHPQINQPVTIWQLHRLHRPRHAGIISPGRGLVLARAGTVAPPEGVISARIGYSSCAM